MTHPSAEGGAWQSDEQPPVAGTREAQELTVSSSNFYQLLMRHLVGATITAVGQKEDGFLYFTAEHNGDKFEIEVSQDEEGNGPGMLFGLPNPYDYYQQRGGS